MIEVALFLAAALFILRLVRGVSGVREGGEKIVSKREALKHIEEKEEEFFVKKGIEDLLAKAERLYKAEAFRNAEEIFIEAVAEDPKDPRTYKGLSRIYIKQNNEDDAISSLEKACELDPSDDVSLNNLGMMYFRKKSYRKSIDNYEKSLALAKKLPHRFINYSLALKEAREYEKAASALEKAVKLEPKKETYKMLIELYEKMGDEGGVSRTYKRLLEVDPDNKEAKRELARAE